MWLNLKSVFTGWSSLLSALFFSLMVVQTLRMKIQESPVSCDTGRVGGGEVRSSDPDCEKTSCEDVPRLDLTALTEDNNWGGESVWAILLFFSCLHIFPSLAVPHVKVSLIWSTPLFTQTHTEDNPHSLELHPALHMGVWVAAAQVLLPSVSPVGFNSKRSS